jgi:hypothetical protein
MAPDNNNVHFLTNVTSLLITQKMNFFNKEEKVNFVAACPAFHPERPVPSLTCQISYIVIFGCRLGYASQLLLFWQIR